MLRLGALFGGVVLLVATSVSLVNKRSELRAEQVARTTSAVLIADQSVNATVNRALALADAATADSDPVTLTSSFEPSVGACVATDTDGACTGSNLGALDAFGEAAAASVSGGGAAVAVADVASDSVLVVARKGYTVIIQLPADILIRSTASDFISTFDATASIRLSADVPDQDRRDGPRVERGNVVVTDTFAIPGGGGSFIVTTTTPDRVGLAGDSVALYVILLALGTVLIGLAGWTFLIDRRSLERRATTDELTGLVNRREFERLSEESLLVAERFRNGVCLMLLDLNGFKEINDSLGHQFGDLVLEAVAGRLRDAVRDTDTVGRWGGDEFVILLPGIEDGTAVRNSAERIGARLGSTPVVGDVSITGAIGAALFPRHGATFDELVRAADLAMYGAKTSGVTHRLADPLTHVDVPEVRASDYSGPDRRKSTQSDTTSA